MCYTTAAERSQGEMELSMILDIMEDRVELQRQDDDYGGPGLPKMQFSIVDGRRARKTRKQHKENNSTFTPISHDV